MAETVRCVLFITLTIAFFGSADRAIDSVPAAITVYRNPEFFRNITDRRKDLENEEEDKGDAYGNNSEEFYDFDDEYKYPGEPKKPNPPSPPEFFTYFDESPEFQPEPREISPPRGENVEEEQSEELDDDENELSVRREFRSTTPSYYIYENQEDPERETSDEDNGGRESTEHRDETESGENQDDERSEEADEKEANEEEEAEEEEPRKKDTYHVPMDKDLRMRVPPKVYEESKEYFNPVLNSGITAFHYPSTYEDLDYYSYEDNKPRSYVDNKKGTREYLKDHSIEEVEDPRAPSNIRADTKHIIKTVSKIGIKAFKPVFYVPHHVARIKKKYKILHKPKIYGSRHYRELPDDSAYQLSSDYDSDFEFF